MRNWVLPAVAAVALFLGLEAICRLLLHLSDTLTPLVVLPVTVTTFVLGRSVHQHRSEAKNCGQEGG